MRIEPFEMERLQSQWENVVEFNLSESSVHPMTLGELVEVKTGGEKALGDKLLSDLLGQKLGYVQTNGSLELREAISRLYAGAGPDNVLVTNGTAEANYVAIWNLIEPGDEIILMLPSYMQIWGLARALGVRMVPLPLKEACNWAPDLAELAQAISPRTKLIAVCNPNNPTGAVLCEAEMQAIVGAAREAGAWLLADEVYQGAEREGPITPSFWGRYEKVLITNGLSKAYGIPGLRIGWITGPEEKIAELWGYHDYTTIAVGALSDRLALLVLETENRRRILGRTRAILRENYPILEKWMKSQPGIFHLVPPAAGAIAYLRYELDINSTALMQKLRDEQSVLVVPGDHFGMDHYLRVNYGPPRACLEAGLGRIAEALREIGR